jgi:hypothetical protein
MRTAISPTKTAIQRYSRERNAIAPSRIAAEMSRIRSVPASARWTTTEK